MNFDGHRHSICILYPLEVEKYIVGAKRSMTNLAGYFVIHGPNRQSSMPRVGFESSISAGEKPQIYALDRAATGTGSNYIYIHKIIGNLLSCITFSIN